MPAPQRDNVFTRKIGPMPMWAWVAIISAVIIGYAYWKNKQATSSSAPGTATTSAQVPQFVNQTYTTVTPPAAPPPGPSDHDKDDERHHRHRKHPRRRPHPTNPGPPPNIYLGPPPHIEPPPARMGGGGTGPPRR